MTHPTHPIQLGLIAPLVHNFGLGLRIHTLVSHVCDGQAVAYQLLKIDIVNIALTLQRNRSNIKASLTQSINCNHLGLRTSYKTFTKSSICGTFRTQLYAVPVCICRVQRIQHRIIKEETANQHILTSNVAVRVKAEAVPLPFRSPVEQRHATTTIEPSDGHRTSVSLPHVIYCSIQTSTTRVYIDHQLAAAAANVSAAGGRVHRAMCSSCS